jgi:hypothetical protein
MFYNYFAQSTYISQRKNLTEHLDLSNTEMFYSKDVASAHEAGERER